MSVGRFLRKTYEITGYADTENCVVYCLSCMEQDDLLPGEDRESKFTPIFLGDEWDFPGPSCDNCHEHIDAQLIKYEED